MIHTNAKDFIAKISKGQSRFKVLGLDVGSKKIGVAFLDSLTNTPLPVTVVQTSGVFQHLKLLRADYMADGVVIGFPFGYESKSTKFIQKLADQIVKELKLDVYFVDEKLTTSEANSILKDAGMNRKKRNEIDDMLSAKLILDNFLHDVVRNSI